MYYIYIYIYIYSPCYKTKKFRLRILFFLNLFSPLFFSYGFNLGFILTPSFVGVLEVLKLSIM